MKSTDYLNSRNIEFKLIHLTKIPKSAQDVEKLYGCPLNHVLKTILFISDEEPILVVVPGDKRVDKNKLSNLVNGKLRIANPDEVLMITGYSVGGVSPFGIENTIKMIIDKSAFDTETVNIGSGDAIIGIELKSADLKSIWSEKIEDLVE